MNWHDLVPIVAILAGAGTLVAVLWRLLQPHVQERPEHHRVDPAPAAPGDALTSEEVEYLDSSHIISTPSPGRRDPAG